MSEKDLKIINMQDVEATEVKWLWYPYIPSLRKDHDHSRRPGRRQNYAGAQPRGIADAR